MAINMGVASGSLTLDASKFIEQLESAYSKFKDFGQKVKDNAPDTDKLSSSLKKLGENTEKAGKKIESAGKKLSVLSAGVTALGGAAVNTFASFESSMSQVQATMGITADAMSEVNGQSVNTMDTLSALAKEMGSTTAFSATECAEALNYLALAGYDTQQMVDTLPTVLNLAAAGSIDLASASDMVTDAMSALGMEVSDADIMVDQMSKTASSTNTSVAQLGEGILKIGATAKQIKGGTAELNTALGILANNGIKGAEGGTHLRNILMSLQNPTATGGKSLEELGVSAFDAEGNMRSLNDILTDLNTSMEGMSDSDVSYYMGQIFNKTDIAAASSLLANAGKSWDDLQKSIIDSSGAAGQMAETQLDNLNGQMTILKSAIEGVSIQFGELLLPTVQAVIGKISGFVEWLNSLDESTKQTIVKIGLFVAAIGPVVLIIGKVVSAVGGIIKAFGTVMKWLPKIKSAIMAVNAVLAANPILLVIAAIAALVAAFVYLWNNCEGFRQFWQNLGDAIVGIWQKAVEIVKNAISALVDAFWVAVDFVVGTWQNAVENVKNVFSAAVEFVKSIFTAAVDFIVGTWQNAVENVKAVLQALSDFVIGIIDGITNFFKSAWENIKSVFSAVGGWFKDRFNDIKNAFSEVPSFFRDKFKAAVSRIKEVFGSIKDWFVSLWDKITGIFSDVATTIGDAFSEVFKNVFNSIMEGVENTVNFFVRGINAAIGAINNIPGVDISKLSELSLPRLAVGLDYVPYDNYPAVLHQGERVMTKQENREYNAEKATHGNNDGSGDIIIPVYIGNDKIDTIVVKANQRQTYRSGGRA